MKRMLTAVVTSILVSLVLAWPVVAQHANCNTNSVQLWRGEATTGTAVKHGASGTAQAYTLSECGTPAPIEVSGTFIWSAVAPDNNASHSVVAVGMGTCRAVNCVGGQRYYSAWGRSPSTPGCASFADRVPLVADEGAYVSNSHDFKVYHTANTWRFYVDATVVGSIAESEICWTGTKAQWFGQVWDAGDQMGGTDISKLGIASTNYASAEGGAFFWTTFTGSTCNFTNGGAPYFCAVTGARSLDVWTKR